MNKKILAIIPARGGSKGVPLKNIQFVFGKPLIYYTIKAALDSGVIDKLIVSTDHPDIARIAKKYGAEVSIRPKKLSGDKILTEPVLEYTLLEVEKGGFCPDFISLIQCTSPFLTSNVIRESVKKVVSKKNNFDTCFTVFEPGGFEYKWRIKNNQEFYPDHDLNNRPRRQDLNLPYHENGAFYITKTDLFKKTKHRFGGKSAKITAVFMSEWDSLQIDTIEHLKVAEVLMKMKKDNEKKNQKS